MTATLMSLQYLVTTARNSERMSDKQLAGFVKRFIDAIDTLLKLPHWVGPHPSQPAAPATPLIYHSWALGAYVNAGYTFAALHRLWRSASYLEAQILQRHLYEVLVQIVHLRKLTPERVEEHFLPKELIGHRKAGTQPPTNYVPKKPANISFKVMFDAEAPGWYDVWYYLHSIFVHGRLGADSFRVDYSTNPPKAIMGQHYEDKHAGPLSIQSTAVMRGFLARFSDAFPQWDANAGAGPRDRAIQLMDDMLDAEWHQNVSSQQWLKLVQPLIGWNSPP